jgi:hypothetical protein
VTGKVRGLDAEFNSSTHRRAKPAGFDIGSAIFRPAEPARDLIATKPPRMETLR